MGLSLAAALPGVSASCGGVGQQHHQPHRPGNNPGGEAAAPLLKVFLHGRAPQKPIVVAAEATCTQALETAMGLSGSIVLAADDPASLARFYGALLEVDPQPGLSASHWRLPWPAGGWLEVYAPSRSRPRPRQQGRLALCLQRQAEGSAAISVLDAWISRALELGATAADPPRQEPFGAEAWLLDPEGNRLLLLVVP